MPTSFLGSALRGTFFFLFGLWWSVRYPLRYLRRKGNAESQPSRGVQRVEVFEGAVKASFALAGDDNRLVAVWLFQPQQDLEQGLNFQMFLKGTNPRASIPNSVRLSAGLLFCFRDDSEAALDHHVHSLLAMAIFAGALCALLEVFVRDHIILETFRTTSFLLQGSWLWQIGFVLSPPWGGPGWDQTDHNNFTFLTMCFCWHYAGALAVLAANSAASRCCNESCHLKFGDIDVELDCGMCINKGNKSSDPALLPESPSDDK
ncbi:TM45B protein, partial [Todus mexicanus]|nr:TM45B protein [Todus mexicanus]